MPSMWLSDQQKLGAVFCAGGSVFLLCGLFFFFDRSMLLMGNILLLLGLPLTLGPPTFISFFARRSKWQGTATFCLGLFMIFARWAMIGFVVECYGLIVLFGEVLGQWAGVVGQVPVIGGWLRALVKGIGRVSGRVSGGGQQQQEGVLPV